MAMKEIRETDWKRLRELKPIALERFCSRVLDGIQQAFADSGTASHQRYVAIYDLIQKQNKELGQIFDRLSRSSALEKLVLMHRAGLLTDEEIASFSEDSRDVLAKEFRTPLGTSATKMSLNVGFRANN